METNHLRSLLERKKNLFEVTHIVTFHAHFERKGGGSIPITIEIGDAGANSPTPRYSCSVLARDGKLLVTGNANHDLEAAIDNVHWNALEIRFKEYEESHMIGSEVNPSDTN